MRSSDAPLLVSIVLGFAVIQGIGRRAGYSAPTARNGNSGHPRVRSPDLLSGQYPPALPRRQPVEDASDEPTRAAQLPAEALRQWGALNMERRMG